MNELKDVRMLNKELSEREKNSILKTHRSEERERGEGNNKKEFKVNKLKMEM